MSKPPAPIAFVKYDSDGRIDQDLACATCGYNLRTLHDDRDCPECGENVYYSARRTLRSEHDPPWLSRLARSRIWVGIGIIWIVIAIVCFVLGFVL